MKFFILIFHMSVFFILMSLVSNSYANGCIDNKTAYSCNSQNNCFWYSGWSETMEPSGCRDRYTSSGFDLRGNRCDVQDAVSYCFYDMSCFEEKQKCYKSTPGTEPTATPKAVNTTPFMKVGVNVYEPTTNFSFDKIQIGVTNRDTKTYYHKVFPKNKSNKYIFETNVDLGLYDVSAAIYIYGLNAPIANIKSLGSFYVGDRPDNGFNYEWIITAEQMNTTPTNSPNVSPTTVQGTEKPILKENEPAKSVTPPPVTTKGWCADGNRKNAKTVNSSVAQNCSIDNAKYVPAFDQYCHSQYGSPSDFYYECLDSGSTTTTPPVNASGTATPPSTPKFPCDGHGTVVEYQGEACGGKKWNSTDASKGTYCPLEYTDTYKCSDGFIHKFAPAYSAGMSPCANSPWCKTSTTTTPSPTTATGPTLGQTCKPDASGAGIGDCQPGLNLLCVDIAKSGKYTCQYKDGKAFTPTPGPAGNCTLANKGNWGLGCACVNGGCNLPLDCFPGAEKGSLTNGSSYCAPTNQYWCPSKGAVVTDPSLCTGSNSTTITPTPTPDLSYQAECPNVNVDGTTNVCAPSCTTGFTPRISGDRVCNEFTSGLNPKCCTQNRVTVGASTPTPTTAVTAATPTPTRIIYPIRPLTEPDCGSSNYTSYAGGTHCSSGTECYDLYNSPSGVCAVKYNGSTCAHCAR